VRLQIERAAVAVDRLEVPTEASQSVAQIVVGLDHGRVRIDRAAIGVLRPLVLTVLIVGVAQAEPDLGGRIARSHRLEIELDCGAVLAALLARARQTEPRRLGMRIALDRSMPDLERPLGLTVLEESETLLIEKSESRRISGCAFGHPDFCGDSMMWMGAVP